MAPISNWKTSTRNAQMLSISHIIRVLGTAGPCFLLRRKDLGGPLRQEQRNGGRALAGAHASCPGTLHILYRPAFNLAPSSTPIPIRRVPQALASPWLPLPAPPSTAEPQPRATLAPAPQAHEWPPVTQAKGLLILTALYHDKADTIHPRWPPVPCASSRALHKPLPRLLSL